MSHRTQPDHLQCAGIHRTVSLYGKLCRADLWCRYRRVMFPDRFAGIGHQLSHLCAGVSGKREEVHQDIYAHQLGLLHHRGHSRLLPDPLEILLTIPMPVEKKINSKRFQLAAPIVNTFNKMYYILYKVAGFDLSTYLEWGLCVWRRVRKSKNVRIVIIMRVPACAGNQKSTVVFFCSKPANTGADHPNQKRKKKVNHHRSDPSFSKNKRSSAAA